VHDLVPSPLLARALAWRDDDPDPATRAELDALLSAAHIDPQAADDLARRFAATLTFGTAGLRGPMGTGPSRINRATVARAAAGIATWLRQRDMSSVVIGYDARHGSYAFARDSADIFGGAGIAVQLFDRPVPTPMLASAIRPLHADVGVMVTASHNPASDNGYKVYLGDGAQLAPPVDDEVARCIRNVGSLRALARRDTHVNIGDELIERYIERAVSLVAPGVSRELRVVVTAMHGVGGDLLVRLLHGAAFDDVHVVAEQQAPDPLFPTVAFPNPEEPRALGLALSKAVEVNADLVIALDPDADRCAVAVPGPDGAWRRLTGDEVGCILGEQFARSDEPGAMATTLVSSTRLAAIAARHRRPFTVTLTGFKWLARVPALGYAYEEAIGYCTDPEFVADKDGITAALRIATLAADLKRDGRTLLDVVEDLDADYGTYLTQQLSIPTDDAAALVSETLALPPRTIGDADVREVHDLEQGFEGLPPTAGVLMVLSGPTDDATARIVMRPSGTEPKLKAYLEAAIPATAGRGVYATRRSVDVWLSCVQASLLRGLGAATRAEP